MKKPNDNLKAVLEYFGLTNLAVSKATDIDPSIISRMINGSRGLPAASHHAEALADFIVSQSQRVADMEWFKAQFESAGLPTDNSTVYRFKQNLIMWLATDGQSLRRNLGASLPGDIGGGTPVPAQAPRQEAVSGEGDVKAGVVQIVLALRPILGALPSGATIQLFLSNDRLTTATDEGFAALLGDMIAQNDLHVNLVVCVSGDTQAMSRLLDTYMLSLISGHVRLSVVHGMTQTVTSAMHVLIPGQLCLLINETIGQGAPPIGVMLRDERFVRETESNFETTARYAQPVLSVFGDEYTRHVIEILALEYCSPGALDVVKDSINPMFMTTVAYDRFLKTRRHSQQEYAWRSAEFARFKAGMDGNLQSGSRFREVISLSRLNDVARSGCCGMAGLYFAELGFVDLDRQGCVDILHGYIDYLEREPNFELLILDDLSELHGNNCWHIKKDAHITINNWQGKSPVMIYSDQLMLLREFQARYDALWAKGVAAIGNRAGVISILRDVAGRMENK